MLLDGSTMWGRPIPAGSIEKPMGAILPGFAARLTPLKIVAGSAQCWSRNAI